MFPSQTRTYSPKGQTPVLLHGDTKGGFQAISMVTPSGGIYFKIIEGSFKGADVVDFLKDLLYHFRSRKLLIIWDGATTHKGIDVRNFLRNEANNRIHLEMLPAYSPELNVDEQAHGYIKKNRMANMLFKKQDELKNAIFDGYNFLKKNSYLVHNFFLKKETGFYPL